MNATRRNEIRALEKRLETDCAPLWTKLVDAATALHETLEEIKNAYSDIAAEEQNARDGLPEGLSESERAQVMDDAISALEQVGDLIESRQNALDEIIHRDDEDGIPAIVAKSDEAKGSE